MKAELKSYYADDFSLEYRNRNGGNAPATDTLFNGVSDVGVALQFHYIKANPNPLGNKHKLDKADDGSMYASEHEVYHPVIRSYLEKFGYYDIFLVTPDTGMIVYSVYKELDFATSLMDGPYSDTNFGEAFRRANATENKDAVVWVNWAPYTPS